jgi:23S rRNA pseudouridine1911/1915/1917 synthase
VKHTIVGEPVYGQKDENLVKFLDKELTPLDRIKNGGASRLLLHASELEFELYNVKYNIKSKIDFEKICFYSMNVNNFSDVNNY